MSILDNLEPKSVFYYFREIASIPHGSKNTKAIADYLVKFSKMHNLEYIRDEIDNIIIIKEATVGYENEFPIILQGHTDMVCEKRPNSNHNFEIDGLDLQIDDDYLYAKDTTLGGDDGIAVAYALAILSANDISHPRLEVILTSDEEIGLIGASRIDLSMLKGKRLLNLDSEEEGVLLTSCAGGCRSTLTLPVQYIEVTGYQIQVTLGGMTGGHSGMEIDKQRGNAAVLMGRFLADLNTVIRYSIITLQSGSKDNAIPREAIVEIVVEETDLPEFEIVANLFCEEIKNEYNTSDAAFFLKIKNNGIQEVTALSPAAKEKSVFLLCNIPNGIQRMSVDIENLVESSLNLGILELSKENLSLHFSVRSSINSAKKALCKKLCYLIEFLGGSYEVSGDYPSWEYRKDSPLKTMMIEVYKELYKEEPMVQAVHAGLECGIISSKIEDLDCISFGPNIYAVHTYEEKLSISSVERVWVYLLEILKRRHNI
jgi:aminoacyl-histidine dipeptidase